MNKENTGAIWKNTKKEKDSHPDYRGSINVRGSEFEIALWVKTSQKGDKYFSVQVQEPYRKPEAKTQEEMVHDRKLQAINNKPDDQDLPF